MTATIDVLTAPINQLQLAPGSAVTLPHCSWAEFETLLREWPQRRLPRLFFLADTLTLMSPLPEHEIANDLLWENYCYNWADGAVS